MMSYLRQQLKNYKLEFLIHLIPVLAIFIEIFQFNRVQHNQFVDGCDPFGYARQANLFRERGYLEGLDTKFNNSEAEDLIKIANSITNDYNKWAELIAPPCHHFNSQSKNIILQYPPGTGLILSFFPEKIAVASTFLFFSTITTIPFIYIFLSRELSFFIKILNLAIIAIIIHTASLQQSFGSTSIPITILILPPTIFILASTPPNGSKPQNLFIFFLLGMLCGFLYDIRVASLILLPSFVVVLVLKYNLWILSYYYFNLKKIITTFIGFCVTSSITIYANKINAGGFFSSTYAKDDASAPVFNSEIILKNLSYYFFESYGGNILILACITLIIRFFKYKNRISQIKGNELYFGAIFCLVSSLAFFLTHKIIGTYYMLPTSITILCMTIMELNHNAPIIKLEHPTDRNKYYISFITIILFLWLRMTLFSSYMPYISLSDEIIKSKSIIWSDTVAGTAIYYYNKYAGKLYDAETYIQDLIIDQITSQGYRQYLIQDSSRLENILIHRMSVSKVKEVGAFQSFFFNFPVWELNSIDKDAICNVENKYKISSGPHIFSEAEIKNIKLSFVNIEVKNEFIVIHLNLENYNKIIIPAHSSINSPFRIIWRYINQDSTARGQWDMRKDILFDVQPGSSMAINIFVPKNKLDQISQLSFSFMQEGQLKAYAVGVEPLNIQINKNILVN